MDKKGVIDLAKRLIDSNPGNLVNPDNYLRHLEGNYNVAGELVDKIVSKYPNIPLVKEEVSLAAGLHDIGRPLRKNQLFHELRGANYIEENGIKKGVTDSWRQIYRIAQMFRSHGFLYERWNNPDNSGFRKEFEPIETSLLLPRTWQEAIVTLSDFSNIDGERVNIDEKLEKTLARYEDDLKYRSDVVADSIRAGRDRVYMLNERVKALSEGKLQEGDILKYGFL